MPNKRRKAAGMKKAAKLPWILGNNPNDNNKCQCFKDKLPNNQWLAVNSFATESACAGFVADCSSFFMKMPIQAKMSKMGVRAGGMMMGMLRGRKKKKKD